MHADVTVLTQNKGRAFSRWEEAALACLARPQTETTPTGPRMPFNTARASAGISNLPVSVEYLTSSKGVPGLVGMLADAAAGASADGFCFLALPKKKDMVPGYGTHSVKCQTPLSLSDVLQAMLW